MGQPGKKSHKGLIVVLSLCGLLGLCVIGGALALGGALKDASKQLPAALASAMPSGLPAAPATTAAAAAGPLQGDGTWLVPSEVAPGTYRAKVPADSFGCYHARLKEPSEELGAVIANGNVSAGGTATVTIKKTDGAFKSQGCGAWTKIG